ncbi:MAG TPA: hypothetical protein VEL28_19430 [Candidatus Binatia bacterium]|nr:hypothetical protein [Candidatus Binatia bacterium]
MNAAQRKYALIASMVLATTVPGCLSAGRGVQHLYRDPPRALADVDWEPANSAVARLQSGKASDCRSVETDIRAAPTRYSPPALYALSECLFEMGRRQEASFWFYAGQLRARFDANRSADESSGAVVDLLNDRYGPKINPWAFGDLQRLAATVDEVLKWDEATPHHYDPRWINMLSLHAYESPDFAGPFTKPETEWHAIGERTRAEYRQGFENAVKLLREHAV